MSRSQEWRERRPAVLPCLALACQIFNNLLGAVGRRTAVALFPMRNPHARGPYKGLHGTDMVCMFERRA